MEHVQKKVSARRCGRVLAALALRDSFQERQTINMISPEHIAELEDFIPEFSLVPEHIRQKTLNFANELIQKILENKDTLIKLISANAKNRSWDKFYPIDKAFLLIGTYSLDLDIPSLMIKETLISSDILNNQHAAPYLSGILKSITDSKHTSSVKPQHKKHSKIRLKDSSQRKD